MIRNSILTALALATSISFYSVPALANKVVQTSGCAAYFDGKFRPTIKWTWGSGSWAYEVDGLICLSRTKFVDTNRRGPDGQKFFVSLVCSGGIQNIASCQEDDGWRAYGRIVGGDNNRTHAIYEFIGSNGAPWRAARWR